MQEKKTWDVHTANCEGMANDVVKDFHRLKRSLGEAAARAYVKRVCEDVEKA